MPPVLPVQRMKPGSTAARSPHARHLSRGLLLRVGLAVAAAAGLLLMLQADCIRSKASSGGYNGGYRTN
ncbi:hypothetical protein OEZ86_008943 [Tetradesmus obliquus]|nr:hypothetical protein OEZ86_008943 [Tetradesmus obliquus]